MTTGHKSILQYIFQILKRGNAITGGKNMSLLFLYTGVKCNDIFVIVKEHRYSRVIAKTFRFYLQRSHYISDVDRAIAINIP